MIREDSLLHYNRPKGFPVIDTSDDGGCLKPMLLDYGNLMEATTKTHHQVVNGKWSKAEAEAFLSYYCINKTTSGVIIKRAQNMRTLATLSATEETAAEYHMLLNRKCKFPHKFEPWQYPRFWTRGLPLKAIIDAPMHLVFWGGCPRHHWVYSHVSLEA
jgi:hypothetical protein